VWRRHPGTRATLLVQNSNSALEGEGFEFHVAQAEADIDVGEAGADQAGRVRLAVDVQLDLRLQDEPLCEQEFVGGLRFGGEDGPRR